MTEYGVACLLTNSSVIELTNTVPFIDSLNIPHISLFQFATNELNIINSIQMLLNKLTITSFFTTKGISRVGENIFLDIEDDSTLRSASDKVSNYFHRNHRPIKPLSQIDINDLDSKKSSLVEKYGIYWVQELFCPHVTLLYEDSTIVNSTHLAPQIIYIHNPKIYQIDAAGRILASCRNHLGY